MADNFGIAIDALPEAGALNESDQVVVNQGRGDAAVSRVAEFGDIRELIETPIIAEIIAIKESAAREMSQIKQSAVAETEGIRDSILTDAQRIADDSSGAMQQWVENKIFEAGIGIDTGDITREINSAVDGHNESGAAHAALMGGKAPAEHAGSTAVYGAAAAGIYGHARFPSPATTADVPESAWPYTHKGVTAAYNLNDYRTAGIYTLYNPSAGSTNFPAGWGTGTSNAAVLEVVPFSSNTAVRQTLHKRGTNQIWTRYSASATSWGAWERLAAAGEIFTPRFRYLHHVNLSFAGGALYFILTRVSFKVLSADADSLDYDSLAGLLYGQGFINESACMPATGWAKIQDGSEVNYIAEGVFSGGIDIGIFLSQEDFVRSEFLTRTGFYLTDVVLDLKA